MLEQIYEQNLQIQENKTLIVYLMLQSKQRVDYETLYDMLGVSRRTFGRLIATVRDSLEMARIHAQIIYNRSTKTYELVKVCNY